MGVWGYPPIGYCGQSDQLTCESNPAVYIHTIPHSTCSGSDIDTEALLSLSFTIHRMTNIQYQGSAISLLRPTGFAIRIQMPQAVQRRIAGMLLALYIIHGYICVPEI